MGILGNGKTLSLDFGSDIIKGVVGKQGKKGISVEKCFSIELPVGLYEDGEIKDLDSMTYLLRSGLSEHGINQLSTHVVINSTSVVMREVTLPKVSREEIEAIITYQLEDYIPINPEDYVVKYLQLGAKVEEGVEKLALLLVGIPRTMIQSHLTLLKNVNLKPDVMDYHGNAIAKLIGAGGLINDSYDNNKTIACIDLGAKYTDLTIVEDGKVRVARVIEKGYDSVVENLMMKVPNLEEAEIKKMIASIEDVSRKPTSEDENRLFIETLRDNLYEILDRIEMIFRYYKTREVSNEIDLMVLYGGLSNISGIDKMCIDFFDMDATVLKSLNKIKINDRLGIYANAMGGLIRLSEVRK